MIRFEEPRRDRSETVKNVAKTGAYLTGAGAIGYGGYKAGQAIHRGSQAIQRIGATTAGEVRKAGETIRGAIPDIKSEIQRAGHKATEEILPAVKSAVEEAQATARHFTGTSERTRAATAHLYSAGRLWQTVGFRHANVPAPTGPGGAEMLLHPELLKAHVRKAFRQGLKFGGGRKKPTMVEQLGRNIANIAIRQPRTIPGRLARTALRRVSTMSSLEEYIAFKKAEPKETKPEEDKDEKSKKLKQFKKFRRRSHAGGT